jgi:hypothetical protein
VNRTVLVVSRDNRSTGRRQLRIASISSAATGLPSTPPWLVPASMSVHHCRRISPGSGWLTCSRTREISTLKA